jgi:CubicO group peptidase (beta-lactamase class C family)
MPIKKELRHFYGKHWRTVVRPRILARAGNRCERCHVPNGLIARRCAGGHWYDVRAVWVRGGTRRDGILKTWRDEAGHPVAKPKGAVVRSVGIVLTVAHLNHQAGDDRDENLKALCQWCHLLHDRVHHHETRATRKDLARPILGGLNGATGTALQF